MRVSCVGCLCALASVIVCLCVSFDLLCDVVWFVFEFVLVCACVCVCVLFV